MNKIQTGIVFIAAALSYNCLYIPQPIQPHFAEIYNVSLVSAALLTSLTLIPLGIAPIVYGFLVESISPKIILMTAVFILALSQFLFVIVDNFNWMVVLRVVQGFMFPAIFTSIMTYISKKSSSHRAGQNIRLYIAVSIVGGFSGRFFSGLFTSMYRWEFYFVFSGVMLLLIFCALFKLDGNVGEVKRRIEPNAILHVLKQKSYFKYYALTFVGFFIFAAIMNFIPFRITQIEGRVNTEKIGFLYLGYLFGIVSSLSITRIQKYWPNPKHVLLCGLGISAVSIVFLLTSEYYLIVLDMVLICGAFFMTHAFLSGHVNHLARTNKGIVNGLYVSFYYAGGAAGSFIPGFILAWGQWSGFVMFIFSLCLIQLYLVFSLKKETVP